MGFTVQVTENTTGAPRSGTITVTAGDADPVTVTVNQETQDSLSVSPEALDFDYTGYPAQTVTVATSADDYTATSTEDWVNITQNNGTFTVTLDSNDTGAERTGTITINAGTADEVTIPITQAAQDTLSVTPANYTAEYNVQTPYAYTVTTSADSFSATTDAEWVTIVESDGTFSVNANSDNTTGTTRVATITVTAGNAEPVTATFTQGAQDTLVVNPVTINFAALLGLSVDVDVTASLGVYVAVSNNTAWLTVTQVGPVITVVALTNLTGVARVGTITVTSGNAAPVTITVNQAAQGVLNVNPTNLTFGYNDVDSQTVEVDTTAEVYTAEPNEDWITVTIDPDTFGFDVHVDEHLGDDIRNAKITVNDDMSSEFEVSVEQLFPPYTHKIEIDFADEDKTFRFGPDSEWETQTTKVITNGKFEDLVCTTEESWIAPEMRLVGSDPYILVKCTPNTKDNETGGEERIGYVTVSSNNGYPASMKIVQGKKW